MILHRQIFWLGPLEGEALEFLRQKHGHSDRHFIAAAVRHALRRALRTPIPSKVRKKLETVAERFRQPATSGGLLYLGRPGEGWSQVSPRLDRECWDIIEVAKGHWDLSTDQAAVRFLIVAAALRDGFDGKLI